MSLKRTKTARIQTLAGLGVRLTAGAIVSLGHRITSGKDASLEKLHQKTASELLDTFSRMKGLPMKVGQILSFMDGVVPAPYQHIYKKTLASLQTKAQPLSWEQMRPTFEKEFGEPFETIFARFDINPMAAASIGQVYRAQLKEGPKVAVKVQYPGIAGALTSDLQSVEALLNTFKKVLPSMDFSQLSRDLLTRFSEETDYLLEAKNQQNFCDSWNDDPFVAIPEPFHDYCRSKILVTELQNGMSFDQVLSSSSPEAKSQYGQVIFRFTSHSILHHGLFNTDPHPGNYLFQPDGRVVFLDFGSVQKYDEDSQQALRRILGSVVSGKRDLELWEILEEELLISEGTSPEVQKLFLGFFMHVMEPMTAPQPYKYLPQYNARISDLSAQLKLKLASRAFQTQLLEPKRQGLSPLIRILFGLNSVLGALETQGDWPEICLKTSDSSN